MSVLSYETKAKLNDELEKAQRTTIIEGRVYESVIPTNTVNLQPLKPFLNHLFISEIIAFILTAIAAAITAFTT